MENSEFIENNGEFENVEVDENEEYNKIVTEAKLFNSRAIELCKYDKSKTYEQTSQLNKKKSEMDKGYVCFLHELFINIRSMKMKEEYDEMNSHQLTDDTLPNELKKSELYALKREKNVFRVQLFDRNFDKNGILKTNLGSIEVHLIDFGRKHLANKEDIFCLNDVFKKRDKFYENFRISRRPEKRTILSPDVLKQIYEYVKEQLFDNFIQYQVIKSVDSATNFTNYIEIYLENGSHFNKMLELKQNEFVAKEDENGKCLIPTISYEDNYGKDGQQSLSSKKKSKNRGKFGSYKNGQQENSDKFNGFGSWSRVQNARPRILSGLRPYSPFQGQRYQSPPLDYNQFNRYGQQSAYNFPIQKMGNGYRPYWKQHSNDYQDYYQRQDQEIPYIKSPIISNICNNCWKSTDANTSNGSPTSGSYSSYQPLPKEKDKEIIHLRTKLKASEDRFSRIDVGTSSSKFDKLLVKVREIQKKRVILQNFVDEESVIHKCISYFESDPDFHHTFDGLTDKGEFIKKNSFFPNVSIMMIWSVYFYVSLEPGGPQK